MKMLKLSGLLALMIIMCSCPATDPYKYVNYCLWLIFQDTSGNDLVKGIEMKAWWPSNASPDENYYGGEVTDSLYTLATTFSEPCDRWGGVIRKGGGLLPDENGIGLGKIRYKDYHVAILGFSFPIGQCPEIKNLTYHLKCPYIFGDDEIHEFVTYWEIPRIGSKDQVSAKCYNMEFDDKVITGITYIDSDKISFIKIILDK